MANKVVEYGQKIDPNLILFDKKPKFNVEECIDLNANQAIKYKNLSNKLENILKDTNIEKNFLGIEEYKKFLKEINEMKKNEEELQKKLNDLRK